jgi:hypothetical protein
MNLPAQTVIALAIVQFFTASICAQPAPPCAGDPTPAYSALDAPAVIKTWDHSDWTPPPCVGWTPSNSATLVATAACFRLSGGAEALRRRVGAVSQLSGLLYWSTTNQKWQAMILDAFALSGPSEAQRRKDFAPDEIAEGQTLYVQQEDNLIGKATYRLRIVRASADRIIFTSENSATIRYLSVPVFPPGEIQSIVFLDRDSKEVWRYYSIVRIGKQASLFLGGHGASLINRAAASFRYLAGIPADQEPPAAR